MKNRPIRMSVPNIEASIGDHRCRLVNLSVSGVLLLVDFEPAIGSVWTLGVQAAGEALQLDARIARATPVRTSENPAGPPSQWTAGLAFLDPSPATQRAVVRFYSRLMEATKRTTK